MQVQAMQVQTMQVQARTRDLIALSHEIQNAPKTPYPDLGYCSLPEPNQVLNKGILHCFASPDAAKQYILRVFW